MRPEQRNEQEQAIPLVSADDVWGQFADFQQQTQAGFIRQADRLRCYGRFLYTLNFYLRQPDTTAGVTAEKARVVDKIFYHHQDVAAMPIAFCVEASEGVREEILNHGLEPPLCDRWQKELGFLQRATTVELNKVTLGFNLERQVSERLDTLAKSDHADKASIPTQQEIASYDQRLNQIKETTIGLLRKGDPDLAFDITQREQLVKLLGELAQQSSYSPDDIREVLVKFADYLKKPDGSSWVDDLYLRANIGQHESVRKRVQEILKRVEEPDFIWKRWVEKGYIPVSLLDSFEELTTLTELRDKAVILNGVSSQTKARALAPFVERGVGAGMLLDIAEGRFEFSEDFAKQQIDVFMRLYDECTEEPKHWSLKRKIITAAVVGLIIASPFIYQHFAQYDNPNLGSEIDAIIQQLSPEELAMLQGLGLDTEEAGLSSRAAGSTQSNKVIGSDGNQGETGQSSQEYTTGFPNYEKPKNNSPEDVEKAEKTELWGLSGSNLFGYYRMNTASRYYQDANLWVLQRTVSSNQQMDYGVNTSIALSGTVKIEGDSIIGLPGRGNYKLTKDSIKLTGDSVVYSLRPSTNGTYFLQFSKDDVGKTINISYSLGEADKIVIPQPSSDELKAMRTPMVDINSLPADTQQFLKSVAARKDLSTGIKAKVMEKHIQDNFLYSLNPQWSDYYDAGGLNFFKRLFEIKKADCDVANTALVAILRSQGIPARMVFGYRHVEGVAKTQDKIRGNEAHGWAEAYIGGQWITLDATPAKADEFTQEALKGKPAKALDIQAREDFARTIASISSTVGENNTIQSLLGLELTNLAILGGSLLLRRRNNAYVDRLIQEVERRSQLYTGNNAGLAAYLGSIQIDKVRRNEDYDRQAYEIFPPFAPIAMMHDVIHFLDLRKFPFKDSREAVQYSPEPNKLEFLTAALGYPESRIKIGTYNAAYNELRRQVTTEMHNVFALANLKGYRDQRVILRLKKIQRPKSLEEWEQVKRKVAEVEYGRYTRAYNKLVAERQAAVRKGKKVQDLPQATSQEDFSQLMNKLFQYKLLLWHMEDVRKKAVQSVSKPQ